MWDVLTPSPLKMPQSSIRRTHLFDCWCSFAKASRGRLMRYTVSGMSLFCTCGKSLDLLRTISVVMKHIYNKLWALGLMTASRQDHLGFDKLSSSPVSHSQVIA